MKKDPNKYPPGLNAAKVQRIIRYYDRQTDEDAAAEIAGAPEAQPTWVRVPTRLLPQVQKLIQRHKKSA